jgi:hypothetical protein
VASSVSGTYRLDSKRLGSSALRNNSSLIAHPLGSEQAWNAPFKGHGHELLIKCITTMNKIRPPDALEEETRFQCFTSIVQSSGMGKSRLVDEAAKQIFTLPFNLRSPEDPSGKWWLGPPVYQRSKDVSRFP